MMSKTLKVSSINRDYVKQAYLAYQVAGQSRKPLGFMYAIFKSNQELIGIYEEKVKKVIEWVWER